MAFKRIVIIDDDLGQLDIVDMLFDLHGFRVNRYISGTQALTAFEEEKLTPDAILLDLMMPEMNGVETAKKLRALKVTCPIIAFTALDDQDEHAKAREAGCDLVLTKPIKPDQLVKTVQQMIVTTQSN